jgi:hypothetical protein
VEAALLKALANAGVGAVMALVMLVGLYRIAHRLGVEFIRAQQAQAEALARQAQSMEGLRESVQSMLLRDNSEHREMLVLLKYIAQKGLCAKTSEGGTDEKKEPAG